MSLSFENYEPHAFFEYFEQISKIPRGSGNEEQISQFLENFAIANKFEYKRDNANNILIKKPATNGYENKPTVMLQGHMDMVCEKNSDSTHDFLKDSLKLKIENGWLKADGTTLGADDGVAVAYIMTILTDNTAEHPALECLITTEEETGMGGADAVNCADIKAERLINIDSEAEGEATVGCAGGAHIGVEIEFDRIAPQNKLIKLELSGLSGGHSGSDIHLPKKNADKLMGRILSEVYSEIPFNLVSIDGGNKDNAIPRECVCEISTYEPENTVKLIEKASEKIKAELSHFDKKYKLKISRAKINTKPMLTFKDTKRVLRFINLVPNGVNTMSPVISGFVESSDNLGTINTEENRISFGFLCRSSTDSLLDDILNRIKSLSELVDAEYTVNDRYPAWEVIKNSPLQEIYKKATEKVYDGKITPKISIIHAGLECGILLKKIPHSVDAISIGPQMSDIHTPDEALELSSCTRTYKLILELLKN